MEKTNISLQQLKEILNWNNINPLKINKITDSFYSYPQGNPKYVAPFFSIKNGDLTNRPRIILISAAGAVGKTQFTQHLSHEKEIPVFDLATSRPVGDYSMTGVLSSVYDLSEIKKNLNEKRQFIIIDALDEGAMKVTHDAFFSFIDDVCNLIPEGSDTTPFVMTGRTNIMEMVNLHLEEKGINSLLLQIEPFTITQAREFIDIHVIGNNPEKGTSTYHEIVDYIIDSIEGFFTMENDCDNSSYHNFIGYAPVLDAISSLLDRQSNYQKLLNNLKESKTTNVDLLLEIIEKILIREQEDKVYIGVVKQISSSYSSEIQEKARKCYSIEEQCYRLLANSMDMNEPFCEIEDSNFCSEYEKKLIEFFKEHPFLIGKKFSNVVYESYAIATVASMDNHNGQELASLYIETMLKNSFSYYPIMYAIIKKKEKALPASYFPSLYSSLISQSQDMLYTEVEINEDSNHTINICFENEKEKLYHEFDMTLSEGGFNMGNTIANASIDGKMKLNICEKDVVMRAPVTICCSSVECSTNELILMGSEHNKNVIISCDSIKVLPTQNGSITRISNRGADFKCIAASKPPYPFSSFHDDEGISKEDPNYEKYHKLRAIISQFRAHKKGGDWAKKKDKLYRRYSRGVGKDTLNELIKKGIIYEDKHLYKLNQAKMEECLSLTYTDMIQGTINEKVNTFLQSY